MTEHIDLKMQIALLPITKNGESPIRTIVRQVCEEMGDTIVSGVLSINQIHKFVEIPPHIAVSYFTQRVKGQSSRKIQQEFPDLK